MDNSRSTLKLAKRLVIKFGSALITNEGYGLRVEYLDNWVRQIVNLRKQGRAIAIVSSGATAEGVARLGWEKKNRALYELQAAAAVGQMGLVQAWESCFHHYKIHTAQLLLTHEVNADRGRYLNARNTLRTLLKLDVIPIINENDTVSTEELQFGDNDTLAGLVTQLMDADLLIILTDQKGLYKQDPKNHPEADFIPQADANDPALKNFAGESSTLGRGGMLTKLEAAKMAARSGADTVIASGFDDESLLSIANGEQCGTHLQSKREALTARKQWLAGQSHLRGYLTLDSGAVRVLQQQGKSLLAIGVTAMRGDFKRGEAVVCTDPQGREIAKGLINYSAGETRKIIGQHSKRFEKLLGYINTPELIHRDDLILL